MFLTIGTEKVFSSKNSLFPKKLLLQSHTDASFANKRSNFKKIFVLHTMIFNIKRKACKCREKERIFVEKREQHTENKQAFHDGTHEELQTKNSQDILEIFYFNQIARDSNKENLVFESAYNCHIKLENAMRTSDIPCDQCYETL